MSCNTPENNPTDRNFTSASNIDVFMILLRQHYKKIAGQTILDHTQWGTKIHYYKRIGHIVYTKTPRDYRVG